MSYIKKIAAAVTLAFSVPAFVSCVDMGVQQNDEVGYLSAPVLDVDLVVQNMVETKASAPVVEAPATSDIRFVVKDKDGNVKYDGTGLWSESIVLPVGAYSVDASYGSNGFGAPYFAGTASGTIDPLDNEVPALTVSLANALVCFEIDSDFAAHFDAGTSKVELTSASSDSEVAYGQWHYVPAGVDIVATFTGKNSAGKDASFSHTLKAPSAKVAYNVVCKPSSTSWPSITMSAVDASDVWASRAYISAATFANISEANKAEVVYEAIPAASSDWTTPVLAASESGSLVLKGLTAGTEYKVRARVGALTSNEVSFTPSVDGLTVSAAHTSTNNELDGTDVTTSFSKSDRVKSAISSWTINICNSNGDILRTASSLGTSDGSALTGTTDWPYLPVGNGESYVLNASAVMDGKTYEYSLPITNPASPEISLAMSAYTSYDKYAATNGITKDINGENGANNCDPNTLYNAGAKWGISTTLMKNSNYSKSISIYVDGDATGREAIVNGYDYNYFYVNVTDLAWTSHKLKVDLKFDNKTYSSGEQTHHITGLPYSAAPPTKTGDHPWTEDQRASAGTSNFTWGNSEFYMFDNAGTGTFVRIGTPIFCVPNDISIQVVTSAHGCRNAGINTNVGCRIYSGTNTADFTANYNSGNYSNYTVSTLVLYPDPAKLQFENRNHTAYGKLYINKVSISYR